MITLQLALHWLAILVYIAGVIAYVIGGFWSKDGIYHKGIKLVSYGLIPHGVALIARWIVTGRVPAYGRFEAFSSMVWIGLFIFFVMRRRNEKLDGAGIIVFPASLLILGLVMMSSPEIRKMPETFETYWLVVHILFAKLAYGFNLFGATAAVLFLWKRGIKDDTRTKLPLLLERLPNLEVIDEWSYLAISSGYVFLTIMILSGSIWANTAWGSYWSWSAIETWSLVAWLAYTVYLHARRTLRWSKTALSWVGLVAFILTLFAIIGLGLIDPGVHSNYLS